jgi:hypothetical protein
LIQSSKTAGAIAGVGFSCVRDCLLGFGEDGPAEARGAVGDEFDDFRFVGEEERGCGQRRVFADFAAGLVFI